MKNSKGTLVSVADFQAELEKAPEKLFAVAGDERLLARLPRGNWVGGTSPYLMTDENGGLTTRDSVMVQELLTDERASPSISVYDKQTIARITADAPTNGYTFLMIPAFSDVHFVYGKEAPTFKDIFGHPIVGWISGIHLNDLGKEKPKVFNGKTGEVFADKALACHVPLPSGKTAEVEIVNIFERSEGPDLRFETDGFGPVTDCWIDGKKTNFARWLTDDKVDTQLPLIADYSGALINVSIQGVDTEAGTVSLYAPVFKDRTYRLAKPMPDYVQGFKSATARPTQDLAFACNCILNYLYGKLDGARVGLPGPFTFGEIGYVLLNQTMVYCDVVDAGVPHEGGRHFADQMATALGHRVQEQLAQLESLGRLKRFFSPQLAELIVAGGAEDPLKTHRREITVAFLDLRGFTAFAEMSEPEEVMGVLREYHAEMGKLILAHEGTLERFTGDGMMIFFNDPVPIPNPEERAIRMALAMRDRVAELIVRWHKRGFELGFGIGIAKGYATIGAIGFEGRWDYGAIGTVTNLAARLCGEAKAGQILIPLRLLGMVEELIEVEPVGELTLKGFHGPVRTHNVLRLKA
jgi:class 3 adenylate cyclase